MCAGRIKDVGWRREILWVKSSLLDICGGGLAEMRWGFRGNNKMLNADAEVALRYGPRRSGRVWTPGGTGHFISRTLDLGTLSAGRNGGVDPEARWTVGERIVDARATTRVEVGCL
jgi:hypothetical protein